MAGSGEPAAPVLALREAFGDRKVPDISRKITACVACRKQKIKCHMKDSQPPCTRCKKRGLSCTVNRSLQMLLENDTLWKYSMETKMRKLESIVSRLATDALPPAELRLLGLLGEQGGGDSSPPSHGLSHQQLQHATQGQAENQRPSPDHWEIVMDLDSGPGAIPGFSISDTPPEHRERHADFIARGVISQASAQKHFAKYQDRLDHFPYRILGDHELVTLESIRTNSPLLAAAVCAVGALHENTADPEASTHPASSANTTTTAAPSSPSGDFDALYNEFVSLLAARSLAKACTVDDVRALCIGAFWLGGDLSWALVGTAVRMATELQLHKSFAKAVQPGADRQHYVRARLWFLVYACDHHFSVVYGRPPLTRECAAVRHARAFLACAHATEDDSRLVSQVLRWSICTSIFDAFGVDVDRPLADAAEAADLRRFGLALDSLRTEWAHRFCPNAHVGNYPRKGVTLQYHFATLYLCSHAFRGLGPGGCRPPSGVARELGEAANTGVRAALSIVRAVVSDQEIQSYLDGLPIYFDVMIAFAAVFLLKVATKYPASAHIDVEEIQRLMATLVATLQSITRSMHPRHLLVSITRGIASLVQRSGLGVGDESVAAGPSAEAGSSGLEMQEAEPDVASLNGDSGDWPATGGTDFLDPCFMGEYDFLLGQDMDFDMCFTLDS